MTERPIPAPIMTAIKEQHPGVVAGHIDGDRVRLLMAAGHAEEYVADEAFWTAVRVCDSGVENAAFLFGEGFCGKLLPPPADKD